MLADAGEDWRVVGAAMAAGGKVGAGDKRVVPVANNDKSSIPVASSGEKLGPAVRRLLDEHGIKPGAIAKRDGPHSVLTKSDVLRHIAVVAKDGGTTVAKDGGATVARPSPKASAATTRPYIDIPLSSMRTTIAKRMVVAKATVPHRYCTGEASIGALMRVREALRAGAGARLSVNDFVVKACGLALRVRRCCDCAGVLLGCTRIAVVLHSYCIFVALVLLLCCTRIASVLHMNCIRCYD